MGNCKRCQSTRVAQVYAKCGDCCEFELRGKTHDGYVPDEVGLGDDPDGIVIDYCLDCGQLQGEWPLPVSPFEEGAEGEDDDSDDEENEDAEDEDDEDDEE